MKNAYQDGRVLDVTLTAAVTSGGVIAAGKLVGIAVTDGAIGDTIAAHVEGVFALPKLSAAVFAVGAAVNWDVDAKQAIAAAGGAGDTNSIGYAIEAAGNGVATVLVRLTPGTATPVAA
ncbi:DUF2190 family protein [Xanthomonas euroxanthea]|uniref:DUF2190 family protein n=1 Tax=Xanthomonas euroxanthea TaxID=2259622 RepID=A0A8E4GDI4_9XANT|nr:capsid cement protein [Xanthomonas euroxanthea]CAD1788789.1 DUF2190 family protein [Xanthomonas euroxanthea]SYZ52264.1 hypothetical protein CPBF367_10680 [Xanthomonas arboricola pv. juglandis]